MSYEQKGSAYLHLDISNSAHPVLSISDAHSTHISVQSEIASAFKKYPSLRIERVQLDALKALQQSRITEHAVNGDFSAQQAKVISFFKQAKEKGASDIHLLIGMNNVTTVQFRVHGDLETITQLERAEGMTLASAIVMSMCDMAEKSFNPNRSQDGRVRKEFLQGLSLFGARYAHAPSEFGLYVVMRILPDEGKSPPTLDELGYLPEQQVLIRRMVARPEGNVTVAGPTGSGKSTTLRTFSAMYLAFTGNRKRLLTIEDPLKDSFMGPSRCQLLQTEMTRKHSTAPGSGQFQPRYVWIRMRLLSAKSAIQTRSSRRSLPPSQGISCWIPCTPMTVSGYSTA